jgi:outer membrane protein assembly factor BamD (BamD/ComL family)
VTVAPTVVTTIPTPPIVTAPTMPASSIAEEAALLKQANAELAAGRPERALVLLDDHARRFPRGGLVEEREAARVLALCAAGRHAQGLAARDRFLRDHPSSLHTARVQSACTTTTNGIQREFPQ